MGGDNTSYSLRERKLILKNKKNAKNWQYRKGNGIEQNESTLCKGDNAPIQ